MEGLPVPDENYKSDSSDRSKELVSAAPQAQADEAGDSAAIPDVITESTLSPAVLLRCSMGGILMGLANLVPGISGGTMLLAAGVYQRFINAIAEVTRLQFKPRTLIPFLVILGSALVGFVGLAGVVKWLVVDYRWAAYSLFIGLTLGGVPILQRLIGQWSRSAIAGLTVGLVGMIALALLQSAGLTGNVDRTGWLFMLLAGVAGASAMILPGISGGYLLLLMGVYVPILAGVVAVRDALSARDVSALMNPLLMVVLPVGIGVVVGIVVVSNALKWLLTRYEKATLGMLMGLLIGAVAGLWPYQEGVRPQPGDRLKNQTVVEVTEGMALVTGEHIAFDDGLAYIVNERDQREPLPTGLILQETGRAVEREDYPTVFFQPTATQVAGSVALVVLGIGLTFGVGLLGREKQAEPAE